MGSIRAPTAIPVMTANRTARSFALAIVGAEYILGWLPRARPLPDETLARAARSG